MLRSAIALSLAVVAHGAKLNPDPKCAQLTTNNEESWSVVNATSKTCTGQWILGYPQMGFPDHHPSSKTWWMKRLSDTGKSDEDHHDRLYFGGLPSERDIKFLYEGGTDAILYIGQVGAGVTHGLMPIPTTAESAAIAKEVGILSHTVDAGLETADVDKIAAFLDFALENTGQSDAANPKVTNGPVYVVSENPVDAIEALQAYRARKNLIPTTDGATVQVQAQRDIQNHGFDMSLEAFKAVCREGKLTCADSELTKIEGGVVAVAEQGLKYHWLKYLFQIGKVGVFDAGQIQKFHVKALKEANIKSVINMRIVEPINMINVAKAVGIHATGAADWAKANPGLIIDSTRPNSYVCQYPDNITTTEYTACAENGHNFETKNPLEWGDDKALNPADEGKDLEAAGISYFHLPVSTGALPTPIPFDAAAFKKYSAQFIAAVNKAQEEGGHVLFHCTIGYRTGAFPTALLGALVEGGVTVEYPSRKYTADTAAPQLTYTEMANMMHGWGYDVKDQVTGHRFELGSDLLFSTLKTLKFNGTVDWTTGKVTGDIVDRPTAAATPTAAPPAGLGSSAMNTSASLAAVAIAFVAAMFA